jgi:hypothetical protein
MNWIFLLFSFLKDEGGYIYDVLITDTCLVMTLVSIVELFSLFLGNFLFQLVFTISRVRISCSILCRPWFTMNIIEIYVNK